MKKNYWVFFIVFCSVFSCRQPDNVESLNESSSDEVKLDDALTVARNFDAFITVQGGNTPSNENARTGSREKTVKKVKTFRDSQQQALYHIVTYNEGGFVIVSAEKRAKPVLAFSEDHDFPIDQEFPPGVKEIMDSYAKTIQKLRLEQSDPDPDIREEWKRLENTGRVNSLVEQIKKSGGRVLDKPADPGCEDSQIYFTLNTATWGQGASWNANMPNQLLYGCMNMPNGFMLTGCVATAMAEIMNFHKYPNNFLWGNMGKNSSETALLMRMSANSVNMTYDCSGSLAYLSAIPAALKNSFGYASEIAWSNTFNMSTIKNEVLNSGRPVILGGLLKNFSGHAWVCDGYYQYISCTSSNAPLLHMNWGWDGSANGFYAPTAADPQKAGGYITNISMVTNIKKP